MLKLTTALTNFVNIHRSLYLSRQLDTSLKKRLVLYIILLMTISQLAITIYLPSLPTMVHALHTNQAMIQHTLIAYILGYGCSQFIYGPLSDIYGRRLIVIIGLCIFCIASLIAIFSENIYVFLIARVLQGAGIGCGDTMGRAILCDCFEEKEFVKAASNIGMAATITPLIAPLIGGYLQEYSSWRASFLLLFLYGAFNLILLFHHLPETNLKLEASVRSLTGILNNYWFVLRNRIFLGFFIPGLVCFVSEIIYNMMSPFLIQKTLGWSPIAYGYLSIYIVLGLLIGTLIAKYFIHYYTHRIMVLGGLLVTVVASLTMLIPALIGFINIYSIIAPMFIFMMGVGIIYPNTNMGALSPFTAMAGIAGALQGGLQMICASFLGSTLANVDHNNQLLLACSLTVFTVTGLVGFNFLIKKSIIQ